MFIIFANLLGLKKISIISLVRSSSLNGNILSCKNRLRRRYVWEKKILSKNHFNGLCQVYYLRFMFIKSSENLVPIALKIITVINSDNTFSTCKIVTYIYEYKTVLISYILEGMFSLQYCQFYLFHLHNDERILRKNLLACSRNIQ